MVNEILFLLIAYLVGSISPGWFFGRLKGIDLRKVGNKNTGGTNTYKNVGKLQGIITGFFDVFKGVIVIVLALYFGFNVYIIYLSAILVVIGHNYPFYLNFKGGRGNATGIGAFAVILIYYKDIYSLIAFIIVLVRVWIISPNFRRKVFRLVR